MALADLTKQLAQQALLSATKEPAAAAPAPPDHVGATIFGQIHAMQKALKEDEELAVWVSSGAEKIRVLEIFLPSWQVAVLTGMDASRHLTRVIAPVESLELVAKALKVQPGAKPARVSLVAPKSKE